MRRNSVKKLFVWEKELLVFKFEQTSVLDGKQYICGMVAVLIIFLWSSIPFLNFYLLNLIYENAKKDRDYEIKKKRKRGFWEGILYNYKKVYIEEERINGEKGE